MTDNKYLAPQSLADALTLFNERRPLELEPRGDGETLVVETNGSTRCPLMGVDCLVGNTPTGNEIHFSYRDAHQQPLFVPVHHRDD